MSEALTRWSIIEAAPEDAGLLAAVHAASFEAAYKSNDDEHNLRVTAAAQAFLEPERVELREQLIFRASVNDDEEFYYEAIDDTTSLPIGLLYGFKRDNIQELNTLYVHPNYFRTGVGSGLAKEFIGWCDSDREIELGVAKQNIDAQAFYRRLGFQLIGDDRMSYYDFLPETTMIRPSGGTHEISR